MYCAKRIYFQLTTIKAEEESFLSSSIITSTLTYLLCNKFACLRTALADKFLAFYLPFIASPLLIMCSDYFIELCPHFFVCLLFRRYIGPAPNIFIPLVGVLRHPEINIYMNKKKYGRSALVWSDFDIRHVLVLYCWTLG